jgi:hypothetical protein
VLLYDDNVVVIRMTTERHMVLYGSDTNVAKAFMDFDF